MTVHGNGCGGELLGYAAVLGPQRSRLRCELGGNGARHGSFFMLAHLHAHSREEQFFMDCARPSLHSLCSQPEVPYLPMLSTACSGPPCCLA